MTDPVETTFGSDQHGLVWGYRFSEGEPPRPTSCDGALDGLDETGDGPDSGALVERIKLLQEELAAIVSEQATGFSSC